MKFKVRQGCAGTRSDGSVLKAGDEIELDLRKDEDRADAILLREVLEVVEVHGVTRPAELEIAKPELPAELAPKEDDEDE